jgi:hypothetical protein
MEGDCCHPEKDAAWLSETSVFYHITVWCHNPEDHDMNYKGLLKNFLKALSSDSGI